MQHWFKKHKIFALALGLVLLIGLNVWLFGANFIDQKKLLDASQLQTFNQELASVASQAAKLTSRQSSKPLSQKQMLQVLEPLQWQTDQIILRIKTAEYPTSLDEDVNESLRLAQILSFTLHNYELQPQSALSSANISQVFHQTSINATNLVSKTE